ncbi:MAG: HAD-IIIA family hydrolase [Anaerolineales bacterium]|nr:HAD-IIIA family hydrolase [Anaerolineales bacterium]
MQPALFLDRDGVIIDNRQDYVRSWSDVAIYPQALNALVKIKTSQLKIFIITNQSVVGRGLISQATAREINERLVNEIRSSGGRIDGVFMCPHAPDENCSCRKPEPGLILDAASEHSIELKKSILVGDALSDIIAGQSAGITQNVLVRSGRGLAQSTLPIASQIPEFLIYETLFDALEDLLPEYFDIP